MNGTVTAIGTSTKRTGGDARANGGDARGTAAALPFWLKLCGLSREAEVDAAITAGATHIGLVRFPRSPRHVELEQGATLAACARGRALSVVVCVNASDGEIDDIVRTIAPDMLQLHGSETPERAGAIRERAGVPVVKALAVREAADLARARDYKGSADALLFDAKPPEGAVLPGGNGVGFDWAIMRGFDPGMPWFLAGGLDAGNLGEAVRASGARALDLSSGIEDTPGVKSPERIAAVGEAIKHA